MLRDPDGQAIVNPMVAPEPDVPENPNNIHGARGHDGRWFAAPSCDEANEAFVTEAPADGAIYGRNGQTEQWEPTTSGIATNTVHGAVAVPARNKHNQGLDLDTNGFLFAPPATHEHLGTIVEPPVDRQLWARTHDTDDNPAWEAFDVVEDVPSNAVETFGRTARGWVPIGTTRGGLIVDQLLYVRLDGDQMRGSLFLAHEGALAMEAVTVSQLNKVIDTIPILEIAGDQPTEAGILFVPKDQGLLLSPVGELKLDVATPDRLGGLKDAPRDDTRTKQYARRWGEWVEVESGRIPIATYTELGGVIVEQGLEVTQVGGLSLKRATPEDIGGIQDAPRDDTGLKSYSRKWGEWVETTSSLTFERGLTEEDGTVTLDIATRSSLGGVQIGLGLDVSQVGELTLLRATPEDIGGLQDAPRDDTGQKMFARKWGQWVEVQPGTFEEPPMDPVATWGRSSGGVRGWVPIDQSGVVVAGDNPAQKGIVYIPDRGGISLYPDGRIELSPTAPGQIGGIIDAPYSADPNDPTSYVRQDGAWVVSAAGDKVYIAGDTPDRTGVIYVPDGRGITLQVDGAIGLAPPTPTQIGGFIDAPWDGKPYMRKDAQWVEAEAGTTTLTYGVGLNDKRPLGEDVVDLKIATLNGEIGGVYPFARGPTNGLDFDIATGAISVSLATDVAAGSIIEPPNDGKPYARAYDDMAGSGTWVPAAGSVSIGDTFPDIATVPDGALHWESDSGSLFVAYDDGDSRQWCETGGGGDTKASIEIGDAPPANPTQGMFWWNSVTGQTCIWFEDADSAAWVQIAPGPEGGGTAGGITDAPLDGLQYGRQNGLWTEVVTSHTTISDTPPVNPQIADMWFQGTTLDTFIFYDDGSGPIWVQQNTPADFTGYATEAFVLDTVENAIIDAQAFTRAATEAVGHNTDACEKALAAVEKLSGAVTQLQNGHHALKKRIAALEKRLH